MSAEPQTAEKEEAEAEVQPAPEPETVTEAPEPTTEPEAAVVEVEAPAVEPSEPEWPDELLERGKSIGLADPKLVGSPEELLAVLGRYDANLAEVGRQAMAAATGQPATQPAATPPQPAPGPPEAAVEVPAFKSTLSDERRKTLTEEYGTDILGELTAMTDHYGAVHGNQARELAAVQQRLEGISTMLNIQWLDAEFKGLGADWESFIGTGPSMELDEKGEHFGARLAIKDMALALQQTEALTSGGAPRMTSALLRRAARAVAGGKGFNPELKKAAKAVAKRAASAMPRPTRAKQVSEKETGEAAQIEAAERWAKEHGV